MSQLLGYCEQKSQFIREHYGIIVAMLIRPMVEYQKCFGLLQEIGAALQKDVSATISNSFLTIYAHLHLRESPEMLEKCMDFVIGQSGSTLTHLLKSDVKVFSMSPHTPVCSVCSDKFLFAAHNVRNPGLLSFESIVRYKHLSSSSVKRFASGGPFASQSNWFFNNEFGGTPNVQIPGRHLPFRTDSKNR